MKEKSFEENFSKFYDYLISKSYKSENDIIPFILKIYRKLRNQFDEKDYGKNSLNYLFLIMAAYENNSSISQVNKKDWGISEIDLPKDENILQKYFEEFSQGILGKFKPNIELIFRFSADILFQEAHKEAIIFNKDLDLFSGSLSHIYTTRNRLFSSIHNNLPIYQEFIVQNALKKFDLNRKKI